MTCEELFDRSGSPMVVELIVAVFVNAPSAMGRFTVIVITAVSALPPGVPLGRGALGNCR